MNSLFQAPVGWRGLSGPRFLLSVRDADGGFQVSGPAQMLSKGVGRVQTQGPPAWLPLGP